jgi:hypothetical protein
MPIKFEEAFKDAVEETFSGYGIASSIMIKDIEKRNKLKYSKWWQKPEQLDKVLMQIYGAGGKSIESSLIQKLLSRIPTDICVDGDFTKALLALKEASEKSPKIGAPRPVVQENHNKTALTQS